MPIVFMVIREGTEGLLPETFAELSLNLDGVNLTGLRGRVASV